MVRGGFHQGFTRVPPGFHQGSTRFCKGCGVVRGGFHHGSTRVPPRFHQGSTRFCKGCGVVRGGFHQGSTHRVSRGCARAVGWSVAGSTSCSQGLWVPPGFHNQGSTRVPRRFHQGSTKVPRASARSGFHHSLCKGCGVVRGSPEVRFHDGSTMVLPQANPAVRYDWWLGLMVCSRPGFGCSVGPRWRCRAPIVGPRSRMIGARWLHLP